jgi:diguanylate cyclase (GGDEF)-like protein
LIITNTSKHQVNELYITKNANIGAYLGVPIFLDDGKMYGTLCTVDPEPFHFETHHVKMMELLAKQVAYAIDAEKMMLEKEVQIQRVNFFAFNDSLTELANRRKFDQVLHDNLTLCKEKECKLALFLLNIDRFKVINDFSGHKVGDILLKEIAQRLRKSLRDNNILIARMGADEFGFLLKGIKEKSEVKKVEEQIIACLKAPFLINEKEIFITSSIGIAMYPEHGQLAHTLLKNADGALYHSKKSGGHQANVYTPSMTSIDYSTLGEMESRLHHAMANNNFELHYQPKVRALDREIIGGEALLRYKDPVLGLVSPNQFVPMLEETGLIFKVGEWVLLEACKSIKKLEAKGFSGHTISVNVSSVQLQREDFVERVISIIEEVQVSPSSLELEVTESIEMKNVSVSLMNLKRMKDLGCKISIDDFGTGYSSYAQLKDMPIQYLKVDRSFFSNIEGDSQNTAIVTAMINLAKELHIQSVAEGIETAEQFEIVRNLGFNYVQGYYFSPPLEMNNFLLLLEGNL